MQGPISIKIFLYNNWVENPPVDLRPSDGKFFATINANDIQLYSNSAYEIETKQLTECDAKLLVDSLNNNSKVKEVPLFLQASTGVFYNYALSPLGSSIASTFFTYLFDAANNNKANHCCPVKFL